MDQYVSDDISEKQLERIYTLQLYPIFKMMIKAIIHRYKFYETGLSIDDTIAITQTKVFEVLRASKETDKYYNPQQQSSFFYFTAVIKNFLIALQSTYQRREESEVLSPSLFFSPSDISTDSFDADYLLTAYLE